MPYLPSVNARQVSTPTPTSFLPSDLGAISICSSTVSPAEDLTSICSPSPTSSALPTHYKASPNRYTNVIAGTIVGVIGFIIVAIWLHARGIPWMRAYPARLAATAAEHAERHARASHDDGEVIRRRGRTRVDAVSTVNKPEDVGRTWIPPNLGRNRVPTHEELAQLPPTIRLVHHSTSNNSLQAGIDSVQYDQDLRAGECSVDQELSVDPSNLRIPPRRSSLGLVERTVPMSSGEETLRVPYQGKGKDKLTET